MKEIQNGAIYFLGLGFFSLAGALVYFSVQLANVTSTISNELPDVLDSVNQTSEKIEPVVKEISRIREMVPPILKEVSATRKQVPAVLEEIKQVREQVPPILDEVRKIRPLVPDVLDEVRKTRPLVPRVLDEMAATRKAIPGMLTRGEKMITDARKIGSEASTGAVTGFLKGIIVAPFAIIGGVGNKLFGFSDEVINEIGKEDVQKIEELAKEVLSSDEVGTSREWEDPETGYSGKLTLKAINTSNDRLCKDLHVQAWKNAKIVSDSVKTLCRTGRAEWQEAD